MNIKTFMAAAVIALTAACTQEAPETEAETVAVPADETVELNDDGSVKTEATDSAETAAGASTVAPVGQQHQL